jgi:hypothetical protein
LSSRFEPLFSQPVAQLGCDDDAGAHIALADFGDPPRSLSLFLNTKDRNIAPAEKPDPIVRVRRTVYIAWEQKAQKNPGRDANGRHFPRGVTGQQ